MRRVSIVTISFNQAPYVECALRSVLDQDYGDLEYIVVDPGSTDGSREIIDRYRPRLAAVLTDPDDGPADGLNRGFERATGEIFAYLNADDLLLPGAVRRAVDFLDRHPKVDVVCGDGIIVDEQGRPLRRFRSSPFSLRRWAHGGVTLMQQATFFRRDAFESVGGFNRENRAIWDAELVLEIGLKGKRFRNVHEDWALFRIHDDSISGSKRRESEVAARIRREQARLVAKALEQARTRPSRFARAEARLEKWLLDPVGLAHRLTEVAGVRPTLEPSIVVAARPSTRKVSVAVVSHSYIEPQVRKNIAALAELLDVRVLSPRSWEVLVFDNVDFSSGDGERNLFETYRPLRLFGFQYLLPTLTMGFRRRIPDVIHVEYDPWNLVFWQALICRRLFAPSARVVCHIKKNTYKRYEGVPGRVKNALACAGVRRVDRFLAASDMASRLYVDVFGVDPDRIDVVPHLAVDLGAFASARPESRDAVVVGYSGQLAEHKGVLDLVAAVAEARKSVPVELRLLGRGALEPELAAAVARYPWLEVQGAVPNAEVPHFLSNLDIFVMPSRVLPDHEEHDALALVEALAAGLPTIGTRSGIIPEILGDGTGVLVEPGSSSELAAAISALAIDAERRAELSERARAKAESQFGLAAVAARKAEILEAVAP